MKRTTAYSNADLKAVGNTISTDVSNLTSGVYIIELTDANGNSLKGRFIKQ